MHLWHEKKILFLLTLYIFGKPTCNILTIEDIEKLIVEFIGLSLSPLMQNGKVSLFLIFFALMTILLYILQFPKYVRSHLENHLLLHLSLLMQMKWNLKQQRSPHKQGL